MSCSLASYPHIPPGLSGIPDWLEGLSSEFRKQIEARGRDVCVLGPSSQDLSRDPRPGSLDSWRSLLPQVSLLPSSDQSSMEEGGPGEASPFTILLTG